MQEVTLSLAAAKDIAAAMAVLSGLGGIFKLGTAPKAFSRKDVFTLALTAVDKSFIRHCRLTLADVPLCSNSKPPAQLPGYTGIDKCVWPT